MRLWSAAAHLARLRIYLSVLLFAVGLAAPSVQAGVYKYTDENGKTVFSDRHPGEASNATSVAQPSHASSQSAVRVFQRFHAGQHELVAENPFYAPVDLMVESRAFSSGRQRRLLEAASTTVLLQSEQKFPEFKHLWVLGDPNAVADGTPYAIPAYSKIGFRVTQSFNGRFSHNSEPNTYAVDVGMDIGTYLLAARAGTVIAVKDDYHMSGIDAYFADKANYVKVLHADGTYAVYAHIHIGSAQVQPGDQVSVGQPLARSGSNGYSTGPHLHFVVWKNGGGRTVSVPFRFIDAHGQTFVPMAGMKIKAPSPY